MNSSVNFIAYCMLGSQFRAEFISMFSWMVNPQVKIYYRIAEVPGVEEETRFIFFKLGIMGSLKKSYIYLIYVRCKM